MKISGFTIVRQGLKLGYPFEASIRSLLPLVDELIVGVGDGDDGTEAAVKAIGDTKLKIFKSRWDMSLRQGGQVLSIETNKALARATGDWGIYLQADEVLHEDDLDAIRGSMGRHQALRTQGLRFEYLHFYGSYQTLQDNRRKWYRQAVRAIKLGQGIESIGDAYAFKANGHRLSTASSGARVFHYGWSRPPGIMVEKQKNLDRMYHDDAWVQKEHAAASADARKFYEDRGDLRFFVGSHPSVMNASVQQQHWHFDHQIGRQAPDWLRHLQQLLVYPLIKRFKRWAKA